MFVIHNLLANIGLQWDLLNEDLNLLGIIMIHKIVMVQIQMLYYVIVMTIYHKK